MSKSPAFRFYPADFLGSPDVQAMDLHEIGAYTVLLCVAWLSERHGYLTDDDEKLRRWAKMSREQWAQSKDILLGKFPIVEDGWRANPRMVLEAEKQRVFSESQSSKGRKGGRPRKNPGLSESKPELVSGKPDESRTKAHEKPSVSVSVSASEAKTNTPPLFAVDSVSPSSKRTKAKAEPFTLPAWLPPETWRGYVDGRRKKHGAPTDYASRLIIRDLERFRDEGFDPVEILQRSAVSGWARVFKPDTPTATHSAVHFPKSVLEKMAEQRSGTR